MKVGLVQMDITWQNATVNLKKCESYLVEAKESNVELLIFPEMTMTGFSMDADAVLIEYKNVLPKMQELASKYQIAVIFGNVDKSGEQAANQNVAIDQNGNIIWNYTKIHPFSFSGEDNFYIKGDKVVRKEVLGMIVSPFICYDLRFPEIFQVASKSAHVIVVIANWPKARIEHWDTLLSSRAIENQAYIVGVNRTGIGNGIEYNGHSAVFSPLGERLTQLTEKPCILTIDLDIENVLSYRENFRVKNDRNEALYAQLLNGVNVIE